MKPFRYTVSSRDLWRVTAWVFTATAEGLSVPCFLAKAGDIYARHLANVKLRRERSAFLRMDRELYEARRR